MYITNHKPKKWRVYNNEHVNVGVIIFKKENYFLYPFQYKELGLRVSYHFPSLDMAKNRAIKILSITEIDDNNTSSRHIILSHHVDSCDRKIRYRTEKSGGNELKKLKKNGRLNITVYHCTHCNGWHVGRQYINRLMNKLDVIKRELSR